MSKVIAICGLAGAGKSTAAAFLGEELGFTRIRFADPLKNMLRAIGLGDDEIEGHLKEKPCRFLAGLTPRYAMQTLGTEWGRNLISPHFWTGLWEERTSDVLDLGGNVVVEDCRFANEADSVRRMCGSIWLIERPGLTAGSHASENSLNGVNFDHIIQNTGSLEDLRAAVLDAAS